MRKIIYLLICLCFAWIIYFRQAVPNVNVAPLKVDKLQNVNVGYVKAEKNGKVIIIPWSNVLYIEEVD